MSNKKVWGRLLKILAIVICLLGFFLRMYFYGINRSLWLDEAMLALNLVNRSFVDLLKPLSYDQGAPLGFLLLQKAVIVVLGNWDYILRFIPLVAGLSSIPLMYYVSKKYNTGLSHFVVLTLFALSTSLIYYSSELKQYSSDVLITLVILITAQKCLEDGASAQAFIVFGITGSLAIWFSHPALFVIAGVFLAMVLSLGRQQNPRRLLHLIGIGGLFGVSLFLLYLVSLRHLASNDVLLNYWRGSFAPLLPWSDLNWYYSAFLDVLEDPANLPVNAVTVGLILLGILAFAIRRWQLMVVLIAPFFMTLIASALGKYPFSGRLLLFLIPCLLLLLAEGIDQVKKVLLRINKQVAFLVTASLTVYFLYNPVTVVYQNLQSPPMGEDIKPVMGYLAQNESSTDVIYVYYGAEPAFKYYVPFYGFGSNDYVPAIPARTNPDKYLDDIGQLKGRVWFVFSHNCSWCKVNEQNFIVEHLDAMGPRRGEFVSDGATVYLYELP